MDYEKTYKEALKRATKLYEQGTITESLSYVFPELKEREGEKIRKWLIGYFNQYIIDGMPQVFGNGLNVKDVITWLEKQKSIREIVERCKNSWYNEGKIAGMAEGLTDDEKYQQGWHDALEKQGEQKPILDFKASNWYVSKIDGKIHDLTYNPADKIKPKFKVGDCVVDNCDYVWKIEGILNKFYILECVKGGESRPTIEWVDKTFHLWSIQDAKDGDVLAVERDKTPFIFKGFDKFHPECPVAYCGIDDSGIFVNSDDGWWTDEKVGPATKEQRDLLFQKMKEAGYEWDADKKELKKIHVIDEGKAEMDYCFTKMMNEEKVSPAWSEEDERIRQCLIRDQEEALDEVRNDKYGHSEIISDLKEMYRERIDWLKSLKDRVGCEANYTTIKELSERDEEEFQIAIKTLYRAEQYDSAHWLESLKQRIGG